MRGASWGYMSVRLLLSVDYPEEMDTSPVRREQRHALVTLYGHRGHLRSNAVTLTT